MNKLLFVRPFARKLFFPTPRVRNVIFSRCCNFLERTKVLKQLIVTTTGLTSAGLSLSLFTSSKKSDPAMDIVQEADGLYNLNQFKELLRLLQNHSDSNNDEILWRLARALYEEAKITDGKDKIKALYQEALVHLKRAEEINAENFAIHKWLAIITDCYYTMEGTKARIQHLFEMKTHMEKACELKPSDGTSWHVLGMWYYGIADISWYERKAAAIFFATPPAATYEDALNIYLKAEKVEPNFYSKNLLMIGKCLMKLGRKEEAAKYLNRTISYTAQTNDDKDAKVEAVKLLASL